MSAVSIPTHGGFDPDNQNDDRADWGGEMIEAIMNATGTDREDALSDGLADLMHWANREGFDFAIELQRACTQFEAETDEHGGFS